VSEEKEEEEGILCCCVSEGAPRHTEIATSRRRVGPNTQLLCPTLLATGFLILQLPIHPHAATMFFRASLVGAFLFSRVLGQGIEPTPVSEPLSPAADAYKAPISCLGSITDCVTCPADLMVRDDERTRFAALISPPTTHFAFHPPNPQCTDISIGRLPGKPQTNDWITEACACMCPSGVQPCEALDSAAAEAALQEARDASNAAFQEAANISRAAFAAAINATSPEGVEMGSDEYWAWRIETMMDAWDTHKNATFDAYESSQEERIAAIDALRDMFGHGRAPAPEPAAEQSVGGGAVAK